MYLISSNKVAILGVLFFTFSLKATAQMITNAKNGLYAYDSRLYEYEELEPILKKNMVSYKIYQNTQKKDQASKILGLVSLGSFVMGITSIASDWHQGYSDLAMGAALIVIVTPISGTMGIISNIGAGGQRRKSIDFFNQSQTIGIDESYNLQWTVGITQNGLGVSLHF